MCIFWTLDSNGKAPKSGSPEISIFFNRLDLDPRMERFLLRMELAPFGYFCDRKVLDPQKYSQATAVLGLAVAEPCSPPLRRTWVFASSDDSKLVGSIHESETRDGRGEAIGSERGSVPTAHIREIVALE